MKKTSQRIFAIIDEYRNWKLKFDRIKLEQQEKARAKAKIKRELSQKLPRAS